MKNTTIVTGIVALIVGAGLGYFGAHAFAQSATSSRTAGGYGGSGYTGMRGGTSGASGNGGFLSGTVTAEDSESITLDTKDGSSHVVLLTPATTVSKSVTGSVSDVTVGSTVIVTGTTNSDGSVSAQNVQLRPAGSPSMGGTAPSAGAPAPATPTVSPAQ